MKLTESKEGLQKEASGVTLGIQKGANLGITLLKDKTLLTMQLNKEETVKLVAYLRGKDLLCGSIKKYEELNSAALDRMESLRSTIKEMIKVQVSLETHCQSEMLLRKSHLILMKAKAELD